MFDGTDMEQHDFDVFDDFAEQDLTQFGIATFPGEMQMVNPMLDMDLEPGGLEPGFGMNTVDEMLLQLPDVPTHPVGDDIDDLFWPTVPGNVVGEGSVSGVVGGEDGMVELLAAF